MEEELEEKKEKKKKGNSKLTIIIISILFIIVLSFIYMRYIATAGFIVKEYNVTSDKLPENFNGFKIAHLSDIHYASIGKEKLDKIVEEVNVMKPDMIVFTGDLYDRYSNLTDDMKEKIINSLSKLDAPYGKYAVSGNHDYEHEGYQEIIEKCGFTYLNNESKFIYSKDNVPIEIVGYPSIIKDKPNYDIELSDNYKIALIHEGDAFDNIENKGFNMALAGHSHGGQIRIPFIGSLKFTLPNYAKKYSEEHYLVNGTELFVSSGLGESEFYLRAFNKPSFNFYRLYNK